jgi:uncharacterized protein YbbC (DUF1343 family)
MTFKLGVDQLLESAELLESLQDKRCGIVAHPASITSTLQHSLDALIQNRCPITRAFGPQHGMRGDKQDNMIESDDYSDPTHHIPVISLYSEHRRPTAEMLNDLDVVLYDLQDVGCRIYTYIATLKYFMEECPKSGVELWVLDRPNPAGRPADGLRLESGFESFVGCDVLPTRHGLTVGELAEWFKSSNDLNTDLTIIRMSGYAPDAKPGFGWPSDHPWINASPNASSVNMTRIFPGTVLVEGTELSEGRGTSTPLEVIGAPNFPTEEVLRLLENEAPDWLRGVFVRPCFFEPTFHKHKGQLCTGIQIHTQIPDYDHKGFVPYRLIAGCLKALRLLQPDYSIWRGHYYEYEKDRLPIDVINGGPNLRLWVDDPNASFTEFDHNVQRQCDAWLDERRPFLLY